MEVGSFTGCLIRGSGGWPHRFSREFFLCLLLGLASCSPAPEPPAIEVFHGAVQRVGHLGDAQPDFNLMGNVKHARRGDSLAYRLNGGARQPLTIGLQKHGYGDGRRLAAPGDFNADIPIAQLVEGANLVTLELYRGIRPVSSEPVTVILGEGSSPLPVSVKWSEVKDPQEVGQYVDGHWKLESQGLRTVRSGYDRIFLLGERSWQDYEVSLRLTVHGLEKGTGPRSGPHGVGVIMRFAGHINGGHRAFPATQPKMGYQPFGAIAWLRWRAGPEAPPLREFYRGDRDRSSRHGAMDFSPGAWYRIRARCETLPDLPDGSGVTRYSFKSWAEGETEPEDWHWQETQVSQHALRRGGLGLLAHHVDASFGDLSVEAVAAIDDVEQVELQAEPVADPIH